MPFAAWPDAKQTSMTKTIVGTGEVCNPRVSTLDNPSMHIRSTEVPSSPLLSILLTGRDDDYNLDFKYRLATTINYVARNAVRLRRLYELEILVVDWGSTTPLSDLFALSPEACTITRFIYVSPEVIRLALGDDQLFHSSIAPNVALRRASGEYLMAANAGILIPENTLEAIFKVLRGELSLPTKAASTYFLCRRHELPWSIVERQPTMDEWDRYLLLNPHIIQCSSWPLLSIGEGAGALLMHRDLWFRFRGFDERIRGWGGNDSEIAMRILQHHPWLDLSGFGVTLLKMQHSPGGNRASDPRIVESFERRRNVTPELWVNDERWGLADHKLEVQRPDPKPLSASSERARKLYGTLATWGREIDSGAVRDDVRRVVELLFTQHRLFDRKEVDSLCLLAWYCRKWNPQRYVEFGIRRACAAALVGSICTDAEIYGLDRWEGADLESGPYAVARLLYRSGLGYKGYSRFVNGDMHTALDRLQKSTIGDFSVDLALVRTEAIGKDSLNQIRTLARNMSEGGAIVVASWSPEDFRLLWSELRTEFPIAPRIRTTSNGAGILFPKLIGNNDATQDTHVTVDARWLWTSRFKCHVARAWRFARTPRQYVSRLRGFFKPA